MAACAISFVDSAASNDESQRGIRATEDGMEFTTADGKDIVFARSRRETVTAFGLKSDVDNLDGRVAVLEGAVPGIEARLNTVEGGSSSKASWVAIVNDKHVQASNTDASAHRQLYCHPQEAVRGPCTKVVVYARGLTAGFPIYSLKFTSDKDNKKFIQSGSAAAVGDENMAAVTIMVPSWPWLGGSDVVTTMSFLEGDREIAGSASLGGGVNTKFRYVISHWFSVNRAEGYRAGNTDTLDTLSLNGVFRTGTKYRVTFTNKANAGEAVQQAFESPGTSERYSEISQLTFPVVAWKYASMPSTGVATTVSVEEEVDGSWEQLQHRDGDPRATEPNFKYLNKCKNDVPWSQALGICGIDTVRAVEQQGSKLKMTGTFYASPLKFTCKVDITGQDGGKYSYTAAASGTGTQMECDFATASTNWAGQSKNIFSKSVYFAGDGEKLGPKFQVLESGEGTSVCTNDGIMAAVLTMYQTDFPAKVVKFNEADSASICWGLAGYALATPNQFFFVDNEQSYGNGFSDNGRDKRTCNCDACCGFNVYFECPAGYKPFEYDMRDHCCHTRHQQSHVFRVEIGSSGYRLRQYGDNCGDPNEATFYGMCRQSAFRPSSDLTIDYMSRFLYTNQGQKNGYTGSVWTKGQHGEPAHYWRNSGGSC